MLVRATKRSASRTMEQVMLSIIHGKASKDLNHRERSCRLRRKSMLTTPRDGIKSRDKASMTMVPRIITELWLSSLLRVWLLITVWRTLNRLSSTILKARRRDKWQEIQMNRGLSQKTIKRPREHLDWKRASRVEKSQQLRFQSRSISSQGKEIISGDDTLHWTHHVSKSRRRIKALKCLISTASLALSSR